MTLFDFLVDDVIVVLTVFIESVALRLQVVRLSKLFRCTSLVDNDNGNVNVVGETIHELCVVENDVSLLLFGLSDEVSVSELVELTEVATPRDDDSVFGDCFKVQNFLNGSRNLLRFASGFLLSRSILCSALRLHKRHIIQNSFRVDLLVIRAVALSSFPHPAFR